jgi:hypothetical protein
LSHLPSFHTSHGFHGTCVPHFGCQPVSAISRRLTGLSTWLAARVVCDRCEVMTPGILGSVVALPGPFRRDSSGTRRSETRSGRRPIPPPSMRPVVRSVVDEHRSAHVELPTCP